MGLKFKEKILAVLRYFAGEIDELDPSITKELDEETINILMDFGRVYKRGKKFDMKGKRKSGKINDAINNIIKLLKKEDKTQAHEYIFYCIQTNLDLKGTSPYYRFWNRLKELENFDENDYNIWKNTQRFTEKQLAEFIKNYELNLEA